VPLIKSIRLMLNGQIDASSGCCAHGFNQRTGCARIMVSHLKRELMMTPLTLVLIGWWLCHNPLGALVSCAAFMPGVTNIFKSPNNAAVMCCDPRILIHLDLQSWGNLRS
jgi:hypothetical protein